MHRPQLRARRLGAAFLAIATVTCAHAQTWELQLGNAGGRLRPACLLEDSDGGAIVGCSASDLTDDGTTTLLRVDRGGEIIGTVAIGSGLTPTFGVARATDGDVLVATSTLRAGALDRDVLVARLDPSLRPRWQASFGDIAFEVARGIAPTPDGGMVVLGQVPGVGMDGRDLWVARLGSDGAPAWQFAVGSAAVDTALATCATTTGNYAILGTVDDATWVGLVTDVGTVAWQATVPYWFNALTPTLDGGFLLSGISGRNDDATLLSFDAAGAVAWQAAFDTAAPANVVTRVRADGSFLVAGRALSPTGSERSWVAAIDSSGAMDWQAHPPFGTIGDLLGLPDAVLLLDDDSGHLMRLGLDARLEAACVAGQSASHRPVTIALTPVPTAYVPRPTSLVATPVMAAGSNPVVPTSRGDLHEPDDACGIDRPLRAGETRSHDFCDDDADHHALEASEGDTVTLLTENLGPDADTVIEILDDTCTAVLASDDDGGGSGASRLTWTPPASSRYVVRIRQADATTGAGREYDVRLEGTPRPIGRWSRILPDHWLATTVARLDDGILVGGTNVPFVARLGWDGGIEWSGRVSLDPASSCTLPDGRVAIGGLRNGDDPAIALVRDTGVMDWQQVLEFAGSRAIPPTVTATRDGTILLAARPRHELWLAEMDADGAVLWQRTFAANELSDTRITELCDGSVGVVFGVDDTVAHRLQVLKASETGDPLWTLDFGSAGRSYASGVGATDDGGMIVFARTEPFGGHDGHSWAVRLDAAGAVVWARTYTAPGSVVLGHWSRTPAGNFLGCGRASVEGTLRRGAALMEVSPEGDIAWQSVLSHASGYENFFATTPLPEGGAAIAGTTALYRAWVLKVGAGGALTGGCGFLTPGEVVATPWAPAPVPITLDPAAPFVVVPIGDAVSPSSLDPLDACGGGPLPEEVSPRGATSPLVFVDPMTLEWEEAVLSGSATFTVYRGEVAGLHAGTLPECLVSGLVQARAVDPAVPASGAWYYLVAGSNEFGEGPLREGSRIRIVCDDACP